MEPILKTVLFASLYLLAMTAYAQKGVGKESGIAESGVIPDVISLTGKVSQIKIGPCENTTGPSNSGTHLIIETKDKQELNIHLGPTNDVNGFIKDVTVGTEIGVQGFRTEDFPENNFVAKELYVDGKTYVLRGENLKPVWAGKKGRKRGRRN